VSVQSDVGRWAEAAFPHSTDWSVLCHLRREVDELGDAVAVGRQEWVREEAADCLLLLYCLADRCGFDLHSAVTEKLGINQRRTWGEPDADGVAEHTR
jgi:NTP pyrophosphatase (non-canonical NTP hydrolase)